MNWYFQDSKGIQGPITEVQLRSILATEFEATASVRQENSNWVAASLARLKFEKLENEGIYLRSNDQEFGPFTQQRVNELKAKEPQKFDAYKTGKNGKWTDFALGNSNQSKITEPSKATSAPPPLPFGRSNSEPNETTTEDKVQGAQHLRSGVSEFLKGIRILTANVLRFIANILAPQSIPTVSTASLKSASGTFVPVTPPTRRKGRRIRNTMLFAIWSVAILFIGGVLGRLVDNPLKQIPGIGGFPSLLSSGSQLMSKAEFRKRLMEIWDRETTGDYISIRSLHETFGKPYRTQSVGNRGYWYWHCKDGAMQLVVYPKGDGIVLSQDGVDYTEFMELNDY